MRILISEDDVTFRTVLAGLLKKFGHEVMATANGADAWQAMQQPDAPPLAILDWMMPGMNGVEVLHQIRAQSSDRPPYIIMLTARGEKADIIAGLDAGANDYLAKPYDAGELLARVEVGRRLVEMQGALIESRKALAHQAAHDPLTGIMNRRAILERLEMEMQRANREGASLAIGFCDIDHFKQVNDTYGHQTGDDVLCELVRVVSASLRPYDSLGRLGGEEFLVVMPMKAGEECTSSFERIRASVAKDSLTTRSGEVTITLSIGIACASARATVDELLGAADRALYQAKAEGRNRIVPCAAGDGTVPCPTE